MNYFKKFDYATSTLAWTWRLFQERASQLQKALNLEKMSEAKLSVPSELSEVRQQMRENLSKKSAESAEDAFNPASESSLSLS